MAQKTPSRVLWFWVPQWLVAVTVFLGGVVNIISVATPAVPARLHVVLAFFPFPWVRLAHFLTLLIGVMLVVGSLQIYRRKHGAYWLVLCIALLSVLLNLIKAGDYEEALVSAVVALALALTRGRYTVRSSVQVFRQRLPLVLLACLSVLLFGTVGFMYVDTATLGREVPVFQALQYTVQFAGFNEPVVPQFHLHQFERLIDSLQWLTVLVMVYSVASLFQPVLVWFSHSAAERRRAHALLEQYGSTSLDYFKLWPDKAFFFSTSGLSFVAYRVAHGIALALGDPVGGDISVCITQFRAFCDQHGWRVAFHQTVPDNLATYTAQGFGSFCIGDEGVVNLADFSLSGGKQKPLRYVLNKFRKNSYIVRRLEPPLSPDILLVLEEISDSWLTLPSRRERTFTLGQFTEAYIRQTPVYVVYEPFGHPIAFTNIVPSFVPGQATNDLMRFHRAAPNSTMEFLFLEMFQDLKSKGYRNFSLGLAPLSSMESRKQGQLDVTLVHGFLQRLSFLFHFQGMRTYKAKFADSWEPRYIVFETVLGVPNILRALSTVSRVK